MKVILTQDVVGLGKKLDVKNVSDGHALNMLIPRGLAREATAGALKQAEAQKARWEAERKVQEELLLKNIAQIEDKAVHIQGKASEQGHLFASIHKEDISRRLKEELRIDVDPELINLEHPIKAVGEHSLTVSVGGKKAKFKLVIEAEK